MFCRNSQRATNQPALSSCLKRRKVYWQIPLYTNTSQALIKRCTSELIRTVLIRTYMFFFSEPWKTGDFTWIEKGLWSVKIFVVFTIVVNLFRQWPIRLSLWIPWVFHSMYKKIEFNSEYIHTNTHQVQTRRWASEWVSLNLWQFISSFHKLAKRTRIGGGSPGGRAGSGSRNWKGSPLLFITAKNPVKNPQLTAFFDFYLSSTEIQKKLLYARKRKFVLSIDTDEIGYLSKSVTLEVMNDMTWNMYTFVSVSQAIAVEILWRTKPVRTIGRQELYWSASVCFVVAT